MVSTVLRRGIAGTAIATAVLVALPAVAWAHIGTATEAQGGGTTRVTFSFIHGCGEEPTNSLRIQIPGNVSDVVAEDPAGWTSTVEGEELTWTGGPAVDGVKTEFFATMRVAGTAGEVVFFPTIQGCPGGEENAWIDKSEDPEATQAAPRILLTETVAATERPTTASSATTPTTAANSATTGAMGAASGSEPATTTAAREIAYTRTNNTALIIYSTIIALVVIGIGGFVLSRRRSSEP